jgi:hypothetical protein
MNQELVDQKASDISQWLQDAVGDLAYDHFPMEPKWDRKIRQAKKDGVTDIKGWLADEYYNDVDTLMDLVGDRIFDAASTIKRDSKDDLSHDAYFMAIASVMREKYAHRALGIALRKIIERRKKCLE